MTFTCPLNSKWSNESDCLPRYVLPAPLRPNSISKIWNNFGVIRQTNNGQYYAHTGADITAPAGTPLLAIAPGIVERVVYRRSGWGNRIYLRITAGPYRNFCYAYCHCAKMSAVKNQVVATGTPVATVGNSGNSTGAHLHLMIGSKLQWHGYRDSPQNTSLRGLSNPLDLLDFELYAGNVLASPSRPLR